MSKEFFDTMEEIIKISNRVKFWEGSHPEIEGERRAEVECILGELRDVEDEIKRDLKQKATGSTLKKKRKA